MPSPKAAKSKNPYSVHPGVAMVQKWIADLPKKTGRTLEQWIAHIKKAGPPDENESRRGLRPPRDGFVVPDDAGPAHQERRGSVGGT